MRAKVAALAAVLAVCVAAWFWVSRARATEGMMGSLDLVATKLSGWGYLPTAASPVQTTLGGRPVVCHRFAASDRAPDELPFLVYVPVGSNKVIAVQATVLYTKRVTDEEYCPANNRECAPRMALKSLARRTIAYRARDDAWQRAAVDPLTFERKVAGYNVKCTITRAGGRGQLQEYVVTGRE